jgi:peptidyl-prolyl cis-trans isomerase D
MLNIMRKYSGSIIIKILLGAIVLVFMFWGVGSFQSQRTDKVAEIDGKSISLQQYQTAYNNLVEQYQRKYGAAFNEELIKSLNIKEYAINMVVERSLLIREAKKLGLKVSDEELLNIIQQNTVFQKNGIFDPELYKKVLKANRLTPEQFETDYRDNMLIEKLSDIVTKSVKASDEEARKLYEWGNSAVDIEYALFEFSKYKDIKPSSDEIKKYFEEHKDTYKIDPKIKVKYFNFNIADYEKNIKNSDEDISNYYNANIAKYKTPKKVEARHILFKTDKNADEKAIESQRKEALRIINMLKAGKDFGELAKQYSDCPSAEKGGFLGTFAKEDMVKPFADKAFSMKEKEISKPVKTKFGWHIIKVEKVYKPVTKSFKEVKNEIDTTLKNKKAKMLAFDEAEALYADIIDTGVLDTVAQKRNMTLFETDYFTLEKGPKRIKQARLFANTAFNLKQEQISDIQDFGDEYVIMKLVDDKPSQLPELKKVKAKVRENLIDKIKEEKAFEDSKKMLADLNNSVEADFSKMAKKYNVTTKSTGFFKRRAPIPAIGYEQDLSAAAFNNISANKIYPDTSIKGKSGYYVIKFAKLQIPSKKEFDKIRKEAVNSLFMKRKQKAFRQWISELKKKSEIKIFEKNFK